jgi:hypothetical protein
MVEKKEGWIDVNEIMPRVSIHDIAAYFRFDLGETFGSSGEQRTRCPVVACDGHDDYRSVSVNVSDPKGRWKCHRSGYGCGAQGDKLTLIHCLETGSMPAGKLSGQDFRHAAKTLQTIAHGAAPVERTEPMEPAKTTAESRPSVDDLSNTPLSESESESIQRLARLDEHFVVDPSEMPPAARRYMQSRDWMTPEFCKEARCGFLPSSAKGTLRGQWVFGVFDEEGEALSWVGRDLKFAEKFQGWESKGRKGPEPAKYKFPSKAYFRRKFELFGQEQLNQPEHDETLRRLGLTITEGFNDVLRFRSLDVPSVGIMSNRMTPEQIAKVVRLAEERASGKVNIMFDADLKGDEGAKESLWQLAQTGLDVKLTWSRSMFNERFKDREAESVTEAEWQDIESNLTR